jgi:hypothetical protein
MIISISICDPTMLKFLMIIFFEKSICEWFFGIYHMFPMENSQKNPFVWSSLNISTNNYFISKFNYLFFSF